MFDAQFEIAGGTVPGRDHLGRNGLLIGRNNQDFFTWDVSARYIAAVVTDGCGSRAHSEFGAALGAKLLLSSIRHRVGRTHLTGSPAARHSFWESVRQDVLAQLRVLGLAMAGEHSFGAIVGEYLLFATMVLLVLPEETQVVSIGDGFYAVNGRTHTVGPFAGNKPPYLAYGLLETEFSDTPELLRFTEQAVLPTEKLISALIGTDGMHHMVAAQECYLPGGSEKVGALTQFWERDHYFTNRDAIRRRLVLMNSEVNYLDGESGESVNAPGLLRDDTTLIVLRRQEGGDP